MKNLYVALVVAALVVLPAVPAEAGCLFKGRLRGGLKATAAKAGGVLRAVLPPYRR